MDDAGHNFERLRSELFGVAYGILGSVADAEEVVQESWLRLQRADSEEIGDLRAWLATVVARLALDALGSARSRRESYVGDWLPEPLVEELDGGDPAQRITLDENVATALGLVLERLSPAERTAFLLHDSFGMPFAAIADLVGRSPVAVRQLAARARRNVRGARPRFPASREEQERILTRFVLACQTGVLEDLLAVLDPEVAYRSDGGGEVPAARVPVRGADRVARALIAIGKKQRRQGRAPTGRPAIVNGGAGLVFHDGKDLNVMSFGFNAGRIAAIQNVRNPEKLKHVAVPA